jgi:DNA-binding IclR family transcriptional regulator
MTDLRTEIRSIFRASAPLSPGKRLVLLQYAVQDRLPSGAVRVPGAELAAATGMNLPQLSRERTYLVTHGWLEESPADRQGVTRAYRLTAKALGVEDAPASTTEQTAA